MKKTTILCPVCNKFKFKETNDYDICRYCGWENEDFYNGGGANDLSLNEYKIRYEIYLSNNPKYIWKKHGLPNLTNTDKCGYWHKFSICNKNLILLSKNCGCFYCGKIFDKSLIVDYVEDMNDLTALCPFCGIDSILPDSKVKLSKDILESMYKVWF